MTYQRNETPEPLAASAATPGPWQVRQVYAHRSTAVVAYRVTTESGVEILHVDDYAGDLSRLSADASLVAAAPDMLAALRALDRWDAEEYGSGEIYMVQARAAIAKATGRTT